MRRRECDYPYAYLKEQWLLQEANEVPALTEFALQLSKLDYSLPQNSLQPLHSLN